MKNTFLASAIALGIGLSSVSFSPSAHAAITMSVSERGDLVEQRIHNLAESGEKKIYQRYLKHPMIESFSIEMGEYQRDDANQSASYQQIGSLSLRIGGEVKRIEMVTDNQVDYSDALSAQDILARISVAMTFDTEILDTDELSIVNNVMQALNVHTDLLEGNVLKEYISVEPFSKAEDDFEFTSDGFSYEGTYHDDTIADGAGKGHFKINSLTVKVADEFSDAKEVAFALEPFHFDFQVNEKGEFTLDSSQIDASFGEEAALSVAKLSGEGNYEYDETISDFLGKQHYIAHDVEVVSGELPMPLLFDSIEMITDAAVDGGLYRGAFETIVNPQAGSLSMLTDGAFDVEQVRLGIAVDRLSAETLNALNNYYYTLTEQDFDSLSEKDTDFIKGFFTEVSENDASMNGDFVIKTDVGNVTAVGHIRMLENSNISGEQWADAIDDAVEGDEEAFMTLLEKGVEYVATIKVPISLLEALGMAEMAEMMGAPYVKNDGTNLVVDIESKGQGIRINGQSLEALEAGM